MLSRRLRELGTSRCLVVQLLATPTAVIAALTINPATPAAAQTPPSPPRWQVVTLQSPAAGTPSSFAEPGIAIGADGTAIVNAATANTGAPPTIWLSHDGATTWDRGRDFDPAHLSTGDADAAIATDGYRYALNLGYNPNPPAQPTNPTVLVYRSRDGQQWAGPGHFPPPHGTDQPDRPWLLVDPQHPADVDMVNSEGGGNIVFWHSTDHGANFAGPVAVTSGANSQAALALSSRPLFDPTDSRRIDMLYETASPAGLAATQTGSPPFEFPMTQLWLAESRDAGLSWSNHLVLDTAALADPTLEGTLAHLLVASAVDPSGHLFAAFSLRPKDGTPTRIEVMHSVDRGVSWSPPTQVDTPTASNVMPALAASPNGHVYLSWYGSAAADFRDPAANWTEMFAESSDPLSTRPTFAVNQVSGEQPVHIGAINTAGAVGSDVGNNWGLRDFQSLAVDGCGLPHPVWADDNGAALTQTGLLLNPDARSACARPPSAQSGQNGQNPDAALTGTPNTGAAGIGAVGGVLALLGLCGAAATARRRRTT